MSLSSLITEVETKAKKAKKSPSTDKCEFGIMHGMVLSFITSVGVLNWATCLEHLASKGESLDEVNWVHSWVDFQINYKVDEKRIEEAQSKLRALAKNTEIFEAERCQHLNDMAQRLHSLLANHKAQPPSDNHPTGGALVFEEQYSRLDFPKKRAIESSVLAATQEFRDNLMSLYYTNAMNQILGDRGVVTGKTSAAFAITLAVSCMSTFDFYAKLRYCMGPVNLRRYFPRIMFLMYSIVERLNALDKANRVTPTHIKQNFSIVCPPGLSKAFTKELLEFGAAEFLCYAYTWDDSGIFSGYLRDFYVLSDRTFDGEGLLPLSGRLPPVQASLHRSNIFNIECRCVFGFDFVGALDKLLKEKPGFKSARQEVLNLHVLQARYRAEIERGEVVIRWNHIYAHAQKYNPVFRPFVIHDFLSRYPLLMALARHTYLYVETAFELYMAVLMKALPIPESRFGITGGSGPNPNLVRTLLGLETLLAQRSQDMPKDHKGPGQTCRPEQINAFQEMVRLYSRYIIDEVESPLTKLEPFPSYVTESTKLLKAPKPLPESLLKLWDLEDSLPTDVSAYVHDWGDNTAEFTPYLALMLTNLYSETACELTRKTMVV